MSERLDRYLNNPSDNVLFLHASQHYPETQIRAFLQFAITKYHCKM